jgi:hypothetical protein
LFQGKAVFGQRGGARRRIQEIVAKFQEKGAVSPEMAMTAQELGLPPRFEEAMKRRLGTTGIFVEVGGKYYLDETRLRQVEQQRGSGGAAGGWRTSRSNMVTLRMARMAVGISAIVLALANVFVFGSIDLRFVVIALVVVWLILTVFQFYYLSKMRRA